MARKKKETKIYHPAWKESILEEIKKVATVTEKEFKVSDTYSVTNTYIDGYMEVDIYFAIDNERFKIENETDIVFTSIVTESDEPLRYNGVLKNILPPKYLGNGSIDQLIVKLPLNGEVVVQSGRGKKYPVRLASYCEYSMYDLLNARSGDLPVAYIDTKQKPWVVIKIEVEKGETRETHKKRSIFDTAVKTAYPG